MDGRARSRGPGLWALPAGAHLMNTGFGPFYDGLARVFLTPQDLLPFLALSLFAGPRGTRFGRTVLFVLPAAWLPGTAAGRLSVAAGARPAAIAILTIVLGALVAAERPVPVVAVAALAVLLGLLNGGINGIEFARARAGALPGVGAAWSMFVLVALLAGNVASLSVQWARVAVRVAVRRIAAIGLFDAGVFVPRRLNKGEPWVSGGPPSIRAGVSWFWQFSSRS